MTLKRRHYNDSCWQ